MFDNSRFIEALTLLKLNFYQENGKVFIIDLKSEDASLLELDGKDGYKFTIGGKECHVSDSYIIVLMGDTELYVNGTEACYFRRKPGTQEVATTFNLNGSAVTFNSYGDGSSSGISFLYDDDSNFYRMKRSNSVTDEAGITKENLDYYTEDGDHIKHIVRRYDLNEKMLSGFTFTEKANVSTQDSINGQLSSNSIIPEILDEMENAVPGIMDYYSDLNPIMKDIIKKAKITSQK